MIGCGVVATYYFLQPSYQQKQFCISTPLASNVNIFGKRLSISRFSLFHICLSIWLQTLTYWHQFPPPAVGILTFFRCIQRTCSCVCLCMPASLCVCLCLYIIEDRLGAGEIWLYLLRLSALEGFCFMLEFPGDVAQTRGWHQGFVPKKWRNLQPYVRGRIVMESAENQRCTKI